MFQLSQTSQRLLRPGFAVRHRPAHALYCRKPAGMIHAGATLITSTLHLTDSLNNSSTHSQPSSPSPASRWPCCRSQYQTTGCASTPQGEPITAEMDHPQNRADPHLSLHPARSPRPTTPSQTPRHHRTHAKNYPPAPHDDTPKSTDEEPQ